MALGLDVYLKLNQSVHIDYENHVFPHHGQKDKTKQQREDIANYLNATFSELYFLKVSGYLVSAFMCCP